jgi:thiol-disulfide isomerase/thioredoxin
MAMRLGLTPILVGLLCMLAPAGAQPLDSCFALESDEAKVECLTGALSAKTPDAKLLRELDRRLDGQPRVVLRAAEFLEGRIVEANPDSTLRAALLDMQGRALFAQDQHAAAAAKLVEALTIDDGIRRVSWVAPGSQESRQAPLDQGVGRLGRAARYLLAAKRPDEAREPLARALAVGANGDLERAWAGLDGGPIPGRDPVSTPLLAGAWFKPLPRLEVTLFSGERYSLVDDAAGKVLVLTFWATWCEPCAIELPRLQALYEAERERGLEVLAINVEESAGLAMSYAAGLGLSMPIGQSSEALREVFDTRELPVVAVAGRDGRVRGRWVGYKKGVEREISGMARELLDEEAPPSKPVAQVELGGGSFRVAWMRSVPGLVEGLVLTPQAAPERTLLVAAGKSLIEYDALGQTLESREAPAYIGRLERFEPAEDGSYRVLGFRPGSPDLIFFEMPEGTHQARSVDSPIFDAEIERSNAADRDEPPTVLLATLSGLQRVTAADAPPQPVEAVQSGISSVLEIVGHESLRWAVLDLEGRLIWLDEEYRAARETQAPLNSWMLLGGSDAGAGLAIAPAGVTAAAEGRFLEGRGHQLALATDSGQLLILEESTGTTLFRARWKGITALAAGDLIEGGTDELVVAAGGRIAVLRASGR